MKIVVLDGHTLNPGDLDWSPLRALADDCAIHARTPAAEVLARTAGAEIVLTNKTPLPAGVIDALPALRYIGVLATGYNVVDVQAAARKGVPVTNVPGYGTPAVAQHVFALLLELTSHVGHHSTGVADGRWSNQPDFCYWDSPLVELSGKTLGIVGWGSIGQAVGRIGEAFGMKIIAAAREGSSASESDGPQRLAMDELFATADVISLHCPLTPATEALVNARRLALMKPEAFLINTGRGPLIVEQDLADALNAGRIAGAALDVLSVEPPPASNPLLSAKNCLVTPHQAWATKAARQRLLDDVVANIAAFLRGERRHAVNAALLP